MFQTFFALNSDPFTNSPDPRFMYVMPHTREALAVLEYGIGARKAFIVLTGEVGTGKTTILRRALASLHKSQVCSAFIVNPSQDVLGLLELILADFSLTPENRTKSGMLIQLNKWLVERFRHGDTCVLIIDEAQNLTPELLEEIRLLSNLESSSEKLLQIVLCGQPELEEMLRKPQLRQLRQRVSLWCRTQPNSAEQTASYIAERLRIAGTTETIFPPESVAAIHRASSGIPRIINLICEHAMIVAFVEQQKTIAPDIIDTVVRDLDLDSHPVAVLESQPLAVVSHGLERQGR